MDWIYLAALSALTVFSVHRFLLAAVCFFHRRRQLDPPLPCSARSSWPRVTVQLPVFNERFVIERLIRACALLDYPRDRLAIQILDDSTDETSGIVASLILDLRDSGVRMSHVRRGHRTGFKAGALLEGLQGAFGEFVAIFDADFVPPRDFLRRTIPYFDTPSVGMVQARWGHLNQSENLLTEAQALMLDGHFDVEHSARAAQQLFFNFNGTAGIWRKKAIDAAGGWQADTLTEDLDLSYRAQLVGWKFVYVRDLVVPAELPADVSALRTQQRRWAKGSAQTARKLYPKVLSSDSSLRQKGEAFFHLFGNLAYPLLLLLVIAFPWTSFSSMAWGILSLGAMAFFFSVARSGQVGGIHRTLARLPILIGVCVGLSLNNTIAVIEGFISSGGEFVRTPKRGRAGRRAILCAKERSGLRNLP